MKYSKDTASSIEKMYESFCLGYDLLKKLERDSIMRFYGLDAYVLQTMRRYRDTIESDIAAIHSSFLDQAGNLLRDKKKPE